MASTYSSNLKIELMSTGENSGTWGDITNTNLGTTLEQAVIGLGNPDFIADANLTITITNSSAAQAARALVLNVTSVFGSLTATRELIVPTIQKQYIVQNNTTGGQSITVKTSAGTGITVPNGRKAHLYVNGTNVIQMFDFVDINGGAIDGTTIGASSASTGAFTTLNASGATTLDGNVTLGNASGDTVTVTGTIASNLLFTDNTYDIGASGATRPRNLFLAGAATIGGNLSVGGTLTLTGGVNLNGNVVVGDTSADTLTINATITSNLLFTDNTYDIGASGATRPRNLFLAGNATIGGAQTLTGALTVDSTTDTSSATTGSIQTDGGVGIAKALFVGTTVTLDGGTANGVAYLNGSKVLTTGSALTFDGSNFKLTGSDNNNLVYSANSNGTASIRMQSNAAGNYLVAVGPNPLYFDNGSASGFMSFAPASSTEGMRLTSTGLGLGTSSPAAKLDVSGGMRALSSAPSIPASGTGLEIYYASGTFTGTPSAYLISYDRTSAAYKPFNFDGSNYIFRTSGTASLTLNSSGNVGIGTSAPTSKLHVRSDADALTVIEQIQNRNAGASAGGVIAFINSTNDLADNRYAYIGAVTSGAAQNGNNLVFATNLNGGAPTERLRIDSSGNLGLGVTPSAWDSTFKAFESGAGSLNGGSFFVQNNGDYTASIATNLYYNAGWKYKNSAPAARYEVYQNKHQWYTAPSGTAGNAITFTQAMTLDASGNLLVGGTTNSGMATVQMSVGSTSTASSALQFLSTTSGSNGIYFGDGTSGTDRYRGYLEYNHTSDFMVFATAATERARITSGGYFKASFDGTYNSATGHFHEFVGNVANGYTVRTRCANASPANHYINEFVFSAASPNNTGALFIECRDSTAARFELRSNGGLANYSANDVNLSDRREKTNFAPAKSYLDTICAIPVQTFNYADQNMEDDPGLTLGVVAQDVQAVAPELVMESNWGTKDEPKMRLSIYQTDLQYALMKALQELKAEFDAYKASHP